MSSKGKNKGGGFENLAAKRFGDQSAIPRMKQKNINEILCQDMNVILDQVMKNRRGEPEAKFPSYITNAFANLSTARFFYKYVKENVVLKKSGDDINWNKTPLSFGQVDALRRIIVDAMSASVRSMYSTETLDYAARNQYLMKAYKRLDPRRYKLTKKLKLGEDASRCKLIMWVYRDPKFEIRQVVNIFDKSGVSDKKKRKVLKKLYKMTQDEMDIYMEKMERIHATDDPTFIPGPYSRFAEAVGSALTVDNIDSDFVEMAVKYVGELKKKERKFFLIAYAEAFKIRKTSNFMLRAAEFCSLKDKLVKKVIKLDIGYQKAFASLAAIPGKGDRQKQKQKQSHAAAK